MQSLINKTDNELKAEIYSIVSEETGLSNFNEESVVKGIAESLFRVSKFHYGIINTLHKNISLDDASEHYLDLKGIECGVFRIQATKTVRQFALISYGSGKIASGTWLTIDGTNLRFKVIDDYSFESDTETLITVEAEFIGSLYNVNGSFTVRSAKVIDGIDHFVFSDTIIDPGIEKEEDESYRERIKDHWRSITENNVPSKYDTVISTIKGIKDYKIIRAPRGGGSTDVILSIVDGYNTVDLMQEVKLLLNDYEIICRDLLIREVNIKLFDLTIEYSGDIMESTILEHITNLVSVLKIGESLSITGIDGIYNSLFDLNLPFSRLKILPDEDVVASSYELLRLDNISVVKI